MSLADRYAPARIDWTLRQGGATAPFPSADDRDAWAEVAAVDPDRVAAIRRDAEAALDEPIPPLPATLFLDFARTGERHPYQEPADVRRDRLGALVLTECLEDEGRFLDPILDLGWAICEESEWCRPAHQPGLADLRDPFLELSSAMTALLLAEVDHLLGSRLHPVLRERIRSEIDRRCFTPYLRRHDFHWMFETPEHGVNNWASVIAAGVLGAACYLEDDEARLAELLARGFRSLDDYLAGFDVDGGTSEGSFCWAYGFGYYTILADLVEHRTAGHISLWTDRTETIARYPTRTQIGPRRFVNFSDCDIGFTHIPAQLAYLARRLEEPDLMGIASRQPPNHRDSHMTWGLRSLFWRPERGAEPFVPARHDDFRGLQWMVARQDPADPEAPVLAVKGGHNGEMHNQNDVGHFTLDACGEPLLVDLGKGRFNRAYFRHTGGRYDFLVNASRGHSVPLVNGHEQAYGRRHAAEELERRHDDQEDRLVLDIAAAYPDAAGVERLVRSVAFDRTSGRVTVEDTVRLAEEGTFETALVTLSEVEVNGSGALVLGERGRVRVDVEPSDAVVEVEETHGLELDSGPVTVRRVRIASAGRVRETTLRTVLTPEGCP